MSVAATKKEIMNMSALYKVLLFIGLCISAFAYLSAKSDDFRYQLIKKVLDQYERPFTMIDVGACDGYYSLRAAQDYNDSVFVMLEGDAIPSLFGTRLHEICMLNHDLHNIIFLKRAVEIADIQRLGECEHFDVVLALNVMDRVEKDWRTFLDSIINLGEHIFIETSDKEIKGDLTRCGAILIASMHNRRKSWLFLFKRKKEYLRRRTWLSVYSFSSCYIESSFSDKKLIKSMPDVTNKNIASDWLPGINLLTFKMYSGAYPATITLQKAADKIKNVLHSDWRPYNMIIQGDRLALIDFYDPRREGKETKFTPKRAVLLKLMDVWLAMTNTKSIESFYLHKFL